MKFGVALAITCLTLSLAILNNYEKPMTYGQRLSKIARQVNQMNAGWVADENHKFMDATYEQVKALQGLKFSEAPANLPIMEYDEETIKNSPVNFDSRQKWPKCQSIKEIRDQSACGSCWAFGAVEAMSDRICIFSNQEKQTRVSSTDLLSCCYTCGAGCNGGSLYPAWLHWRYTGLVSGDLYDNNKWCKPYPFEPCAHHVTSTVYKPCPKQDYPTPKCHKQCNPSYTTAYSQDKTHAKHIYLVSGATHIAAEISTNGPVEAAFTVYEDFVTYKSGIYEHKTGSALGGHAIKILGYGEDEDHNEYWLVANSWNEEWGDNGYFKIKKGVDECGIEGGAVTGIPKE